MPHFIETSTRSIRFRELDRRRARTRAGRGRALAEAQVVGLAGAAAVVRADAARRGRGAVGDGQLDGERGALVEVGARAAGVADDVELGLGPAVGDIGDAVAHRGAEGLRAEGDRGRVGAVGRRRARELQAGQLRDRDLVGDHHRRAVAVAIVTLAALVGTRVGVAARADVGVAAVHVLAVILEPGLDEHVGGAGQRGAGRIHVVRDQDVLLPGQAAREAVTGGRLVDEIGVELQRVLVRAGDAVAFARAERHVGAFFRGHAADRREAAHHLADQLAAGRLDRVVETVAHHLLAAAAQLLLAQPRGAAATRGAITRYRAAGHLVPFEVGIGRVIAAFAARRRLPDALAPRCLRRRVGLDLRLVDERIGGLSRVGGRDRHRADQDGRTCQQRCANHVLHVKPCPRSHLYLQWKLGVLGSGLVGPGHDFSNDNPRQDGWWNACRGPLA
ncbi:hypothetical protein BGLA2_300011 [Burkholderia gladioli]|nr:hypothetical protein BGLA2_300011 [Burkholderia gladioli]